MIPIALAIVTLVALVVAQTSSTVSLWIGEFASPQNLVASVAGSVGYLDTLPSPDLCSSIGCRSNLVCCGVRNLCILTRIWLRSLVDRLL